MLDTDHLTVLTNRRATGHRLLVKRLVDSPDQRIAIPIVSVEEQCRGWLAKIHRLQQPIAQVTAYQDFQDLFELLRGWEFVPFSRSAAEQFFELKAARIRIGTNDLKIGSIALFNEALLLSANLRDFEQISSITPHTRMEFVPRQKLHELREHRRPSVPLATSNARRDRRSSEDSCVPSSNHARSSFNVIHSQTTFSNVRPNR